MTGIGLRAELRKFCSNTLLNKRTVGLCTLRVRQPWISLIILLLAVALIFEIGCTHLPLGGSLTQPIYYFDNSLPFQPNRIWRVKVRWEPYLLDDQKAMIIKQFQYVLRTQGERKIFESEVIARGGDVRYLKWLEGELFPLGNWEYLDESRIVRYKDYILVTYTTKSIKEVPRDGKLTVSPVSFPDRLLRAVNEGCHELNWDVIAKDDSVGFEVFLESRSAEPDALRWKLIEKSFPTFGWRAWSVGQEKSIAYRTLVFFKTNVSRCPLPPKIHEEFKQIRAGQSMGVEW